MALVLAMHLDRALLFAQCAYDNEIHRGLPNCSQPHLDYSSVVGLPEVSTAAFGLREAAMLTAAGQSEVRAGDSTCDHLKPPLRTRLSSKLLAETSAKWKRCERSRLLSVSSTSANVSWLTMSLYHHRHVTSLARQALQSEGGAAACITRCARFMTLQPRGPALDVLHSTAGLAPRIDAATRIGAIHVRTGMADGESKADYGPCHSIPEHGMIMGPGLSSGIQAVDSCLASRGISGRGSTGLVGQGQRCRTKPLFEALPLSRMASAINVTCDAVLYVSDHAGFATVLNGGEVTPRRKSLLALLPASLRTGDTLRGHSSRATSSATFGRLTLRAAIEFYLMSMAHVFVQTTPSSFAGLAHERGEFCGQDFFVPLHLHGGANTLCSTLGSDLLGSSTCAECSGL